MQNEQFLPHDLVSKHSLINFLCVFFYELLLSLRSNSDCMSYGKLCRNKICILKEFLKKMTDSVLYLRYSERATSICLFVI